MQSRCVVDVLIGTTKGHAVSKDTFFKDTYLGIPARRDVLGFRVIILHTRR
jgi:hypothetical protein